MHLRGQMKGFYAGLLLVIIWTSPVFASEPATVISSVDLSKPFATRSPWLFSAIEGALTPDPFAKGTVLSAPGPVTLCLKKLDEAQCDPVLASDLDDPIPGPSGPFDTPHYLKRADVVFPKGVSKEPLLLVQTASPISITNYQITMTQVFAYDHTHDQFRRIYGLSVGSHNNEEIRYISTGPLGGAVISAWPTGDAPFGYWISVNVLTPAYTYRQALKYRSATVYADGNPLPVIDSEMPNIQRRVGVWRPGSPLPLPATRCPEPKLIENELWCGPKG